MTLTSNETAWAVMIVTLLISFAFGALCTWITIKAQHAKTIAEIQESIKNIFARLFICFCNVSALVLLCRELFSTAPIDRRGVLTIVLSFVIFLMSFFLYFIVMALKLIIRHADTTIRLTNFIKDDLPCSPSKQHNKDISSDH